MEKEGKTEKNPFQESIYGLNNIYKNLLLKLLSSKEKDHLVPQDGHNRSKSMDKDQVIELVNLLTDVAKEHRSATINRILVCLKRKLD